MLWWALKFFILQMSIKILHLARITNFVHSAEWWEKMKTLGQAHWAAGEFMWKGSGRTSSGTGPRMAGSLWSGVGLDRNYVCVALKCFSQSWLMPKYGRLLFEAAKYYHNHVIPIVLVKPPCNRMYLQIYMFLSIMHLILQLLWYMYQKICD